MRASAFRTKTVETGRPFVVAAVCHLLIGGLGCGAALQRSGPATDRPLEEQRREMVERQLKSRDIRSPRVLKAMAKTPRHEFVPEANRSLAYQDYALPIGEGQTISQPYIVALMTQTAQPAKDHKALEVGTGSGYQAAVLSELVDHVYTIEIVKPLAERAAADLARLGYDNVTVRHGDGYEGWPEQAPFDVILVTAAADRIPEPLLEQLAEGGRLVMPVGEFDGIQVLTLVIKHEGKLQRQRITGVRFVPMTGKIRQRPGGG